MSLSLLFRFIIYERLQEDFLLDKLPGFRSFSRGKFISDRDNIRHFVLSIIFLINHLS
jgi:hypothetical protein